MPQLFVTYKIFFVCPERTERRRKRGERFGRLGSCAHSVQADKIKKSNSQNPWYFPEYGKKAFGKEHNFPRGIVSLFIGTL